MNLNTVQTNISTKHCDINNWISLPPSVSNFAAMAFLKRCTDISIKKSISW